MKPGKDDILLGLFIIGIIGVALATQANIDYAAIFGGSGSDYQPSERCLEIASAAEENFTRQYGQTSCECVSPEAYKGRLDTPQEVEDAANLSVLSCDINGQKLAFPIWEVNKSRVMNNTSAGVVR